MKRALLVIDVQNEYFIGLLPVTYPKDSFSNILKAVDFTNDNENKSVKKGRIGNAECKLFDMRDGVDFAKTWLLKHRLLLIYVAHTNRFGGVTLIIMLFGVSNVGKTVTGEKLAEKLGYPFLDLDEEIKKKFQTTLEKFMRDYPYSHERHKIKGKLLKDLLHEYKDNMVIAVSPIYYSRNFNSLLDLEQVIAIELQDR